MADLYHEYINYSTTTKLARAATPPKMFTSVIQPLLEYRTLYRIKKKQLPYNGFGPIESDEIPLIIDFFGERAKYEDTMIRKKHIKIIKHMIDNNMTINYKLLIQDMNNDLVESVKNMNMHCKIFLEQITLANSTYNYEQAGEAEVIVENDNVIYRNIIIPCENDDRLKYLLRVAGKDKFMLIMLRYLSFGLTSHHCSLPSNIYKYCYDEFGIRGEGFSSPLNSKLIEYSDTHICTLFGDVDKYVGSKGSFSTSTLIKYQNVNWLVNPPYMEELMYMTYVKIMKAFEKITNPDFLVIMLIPQWKTNKTYIKLSNCKYLIKSLEPEIGKHYMNCNGKMVYMKDPVNSMFFLSKSKKYIDESKFNRLLELWNTKDETNLQQSKFVNPKFKEQM